MKYKLDDSKYIKKYKHRMIDTMQRIHPEWDKDDINDILDEMIEESFQNPVVEMDNNYTGEHKEASLVSVFDWALEAKPILAGNGTFYKNQHQALNPIGQMLMDFLADRKATKKKMFLIEDDESDEYKELDRTQVNIKVNANSYYGGSGMPSSAFYSKWSGPRVVGPHIVRYDKTTSLIAGNSYIPVRQSAAKYLILRYVFND